MASSGHGPLPLLSIERPSAWRPYANPKNIVRLESRPEGRIALIVDPWTQRWAVVGQGAEAVLALADGSRTAGEVVDEVTRVTDVAYLRSPKVVEALLDDLRGAGLLFVSETHHRSSGRPVVFATEPQGLHLEITNSCNLRCAHCYVSSGEKLPDELTDAELRSVVDQLEPFSNKTIAITGGEALVRRGALDLVEYCVVDRGHRVDLYTNAYKFPRKFAERIAAINAIGGPKVNLQVSLEGASAATNDAVRGPGVFDQALASLEMFRELGLNRSVLIFICMRGDNIGELDQMIELAERFDVGRIAFSQWQRQGNAADTPWESIAPPLEEWTGAGERLLQYDNPRLNVLGNFFGDLNNGKNGRYTLDRGLFPKQLFAFNAFPRVSPDGWIFADQLWVDRDWALGNVRQMTLADAFRTERFNEQIGRFLDRAQAISECRSCEWVELCGGGHPGHALSEFGDLHHKDSFCDARKYWFERYARTQVERALNSA